MFDISRPYSSPTTEVLGASKYVIAKLPAHLQTRATAVWLRAANVKRKPTKYLGEYGIDIAAADKKLAEYLALYREVCRDLPIDSEASLDEIRELADKTAQQFYEGIYTHGWEWDFIKEKAEELTLNWDVLFADKMEKGITGRLQDRLFWKRQLNTNICRASEHIKRAGFNQINKRKQLYCSDKAVRDYQEKKRRTAALMKQIVMINELGEEFELAELVEKSTANSRVRFAEMMTRVKGFEWIAQECGHVGEFITMTCPSRFHSALAVSGAPNPKYDGCTPREAAAYLGKVWARIQSELKRNDIDIYGFRVAEPHHDGCPHWHGLFFMDKKYVKTFRRIVAKHTCRENREELGLSYFGTKKAAIAYAKEVQAQQKAAGKTVQTIAEISGSLKIEAEFWANADWRVFGDMKVKARVHFEAIDWSKGSAAGYIAKYIAKNIDGKNNTGENVGEDFEAANGESMIETAKRVMAWASLWGIRQFQQIGGAPVGIWRELRREGMKDGDYNDVIVRAALAADVGDWGKFVMLMGGAVVKRGDLAVRLYKEKLPENFTNKYGEPLPLFVRGVVAAQTGEIKISRIHEWRLDVVFKKGGEAAPWTCVNNSTKMKFDSETKRNIVKKSNETVNISEQRQLLIDELKRLSRDNGMEPFIKKREMFLLNLSLNRLSKEPEINATQRAQLIEQAAIDAQKQHENSLKNRALHEYRDKLDHLACLMQPKLDKPANKLKPSEISPSKLRKFAAQKQYNSAYSVLREAADLLAEIEQNYWN